MGTNITTSTINAIKRCHPMTVRRLAATMSDDGHEWRQDLHPVTAQYSHREQRERSGDEDHRGVVTGCAEKRAHDLGGMLRALALLAVVVHIGPECRFCRCNGSHPRPEVLENERETDRGYHYGEENDD